MDEKIPPYLDLDKGELVVSKKDVDAYRDIIRKRGEIMGETVKVTINEGGFTWEQKQTIREIIREEIRNALKKE